MAVTTRVDFAGRRPGQAAPVVAEFAACAAGAAVVLESGGEELRVGGERVALPARCEARGARAERSRRTGRLRVTLKPAGKRAQRSKAPPKVRRRRRLQAQSVPARGGVLGRRKRRLSAASDIIGQPPRLPTPAPVGLAQSHREFGPGGILSSFQSFPVELAEDAQQGRFLVAERPLQAGTEVLRERRPLVAAVHDRYAAALCHGCFRPLLAGSGGGEERNEGQEKGVTCSRCKCAVFCSRQCAEMSAEEHAGECAQLALWARENPQLGARSQGLRLFIKLWHVLSLSRRRNADGDAPAADGGAPHEQFERLGTHGSAGSERVTGMAKAAARFCNGAPSEADMAALILRVQANAHTIANFHGQALASGVYLAGAMLNHSCDPTCVVSFRGPTLVVRTIRPVVKGEPLTIAYCELFANRESRQQKLHAAKGFDCACARCQAGGEATAHYPYEADFDGFLCASCDSGPVPRGGGFCLACGGAAAVEGTSARLEAEAACRAAFEQGIKSQSTQDLLGSIAALKGALERGGKALHPGHFLLREAREALVDSLAAAGRHELAAEVAVEAAALLEERMFPHHPGAASMRAHAARHYEDAGRISKAKTQLQMAIDSLSVSFGRDHVDIRNLGKAFELLDKR